MDNGGSAFPIVGEYGQKLDNSSGMSLRDYFAAKAMQARLSDFQSMESMTDYAKRTGQELSKIVADQAYDMADAMLKARQA